MTGISNGGYLTRWQLENRPALYDGSVDWEGMDGFVAAFPNRLRPILPCYREAFIALEESVERGTPPPPSGTLPRPAGDVVNTCALPGS